MEWNDVFPTLYIKIEEIPQRNTTLSNTKTMCLETKRQILNSKPLIGNVYGHRLFFTSGLELFNDALSIRR